jgi:integrase
MRFASMDHLRLVNKIYGVQVVVPKPLRGFVMNDDGKPVNTLTRALGTENKADARRLKVPVEAEFQARIDAAWAHIQGKAELAAEIVGEWRELGAAISATVTASKQNFLAYRLNAKPAGEPVPWGPVVDLWVEKKGKLEKSADDRRGKMRRLFGWLGHDDMEPVTPDNLQDYLEKSLLPMLRADAKPRRWKPKTVEDHVEMIRAMFRFAKENRKITANPAVELRYSAPDDGDRDEIEDFTPAEREKILRAAIYANDPFVKWGNLISGFSGARCAEIAETQTNDIEVRADGTVIIHIQLQNRPETQRIKTRFSRRDLPLPPGVTRHGFLDYVARIRKLHGGEGPLFPHLKMHKGRLNSDASRRVNAFIDGLGITDSLKRFHSWRHTIATLLTDDGVPEVRARYITGHAPRMVGERYIKHHIPQLVEAIGRLPDPTG